MRDPTDPRHSAAEARTVEDATHLSEEERCLLVTEARLTFNQQAARELWIKLGLPKTSAMRKSAAGARPVAVFILDYED